RRTASPPSPPSRKLTGLFAQALHVPSAAAVRPAPCHPEATDKLNSQGEGGQKQHSLPASASTTSDPAPGKPAAAKPATREATEAGGCGSVRRRRRGGLHACRKAPHAGSDDQRCRAVRRYVPAYLRPLHAQPLKQLGPLFRTVVHHCVWQVFIENARSFRKRLPVFLSRDHEVTES